MQISPRLLFTPKHRFLQLLPVILVFSSIIACAIAKYYLTVKLVFSSILNTSASIFGYLAVKHDLIIFLFALVCSWIASEVRWYVVSIILRLCAVISLLPYVIDIIVLRFFSTRLQFKEINKFSGEWDATMDFLAQAFPGGLWLPVLFGVGATVIILFFIFVRITPPGNKGRVALLLISLMMAGFYLPGDSTPYVHVWTYKNVYEVNTRQGIAIPFSENYIQKTLTRKENPLWAESDCKPGLRKKPNIIIVLFESLSMYHSEYFSGMPTICDRFERIARENTAYTNFYSNGFTTESAMISILTGRHLFPPVAEHEGAGWSFGFAHQGFYGSEGSLPGLFADNGYFPAFMTSGDLGFLEKRKWLLSLGFRLVEGAEVPFYKSWPRFHFNAAPDLALYMRALRILESLEDHAPYMIMIETVSTHQPFISPLSGIRDEVAAFRFADRMLGKFYESLRRRGCFDNGILLILGDHRAMTPLGREETDRFGQAAASRVPLVVVWNDDRPPRKIDTPAQEADFITSFQYLISEEVCTGHLHGNFLAEPPVAPQFILFPRGDDRDIVDVYTATKQAAIRIAGDATRFINGEDTYADALIHHIAKERLLITGKQMVEDDHSANR